jgi:hypothetical protein
MANLYTRNAFKHGFNNVTPSMPPLLSAYCRLVTVELILKEHLRAKGIRFRESHDIPTMLQLLANSTTGSQTATVNSLRTALMTRLMALWCNGLRGIQKVPATSYPYIRYVRHASDYTVDFSEEPEIEALENLIQQIQTTLGTITGIKA